MTEFNRLLEAAAWYTTPAQVDAWAEATYDRLCWLLGTAPEMEISEPCRNTEYTHPGRRFPAPPKRRAREDEPTTVFKK